MRLSPEQLKEMMSGKTDDELYVTVYVRSQEYTPEAIDAARAEFHRRQLAAPPESIVAADVEKVREQEQTPLSVPLRIVAFFFCRQFASSLRFWPTGILWRRARNAKPAIGLGGRSMVSSSIASLP